MSEELIAEGMVGHPPSHRHSSDLVSSFWGSYFYHPEPKKPNSVLSRASSFAKRKQSVGQTLDLLAEIWSREVVGITRALHNEFKSTFPSVAHCRISTRGVIY